MKHTDLSVPQSSRSRQGGSLYLCNSGVGESEANHELEPTVKEGAQSELVVMAFGALGEPVATGRGSFVLSCLCGTGRSVNC